MNRSDREREIKNEDQLTSSRFNGVALSTSVKADEPRGQFEDLEKRSIFFWMKSGWLVERFLRFQPADGRE